MKLDCEKVREESVKAIRKSIKEHEDSLKKDRLALMLVQDAIIEKCAMFSDGEFNDTCVDSGEVLNILNQCIEGGYYNPYM